MISTYRGKRIILIISNKNSAFCLGKILLDCRKKVLSSWLRGHLKYWVRLPIYHLLSSRFFLCTKRVNSDRKVLEFGWQVTGRR